MSGFAVPFSSSPPSTPDSRYRRSNGFVSKSGNFTSDVSTTPAEAPPSSAASLTPSGPPLPSTLFGSSQFSNQAQNKLLFASNKTLFTSPVPPLPFDDEDTEGDNDDEELGEAYNDGLEDRPMEVDGSTRDRPPFLNFSLISELEPSRSSDGCINGSSIVNEPPRGTKRSRGGAAISYTLSGRKIKETRPQKDSAIPAIAKDMATQMDLPTISESGELIRMTEDLVYQSRSSAITNTNDLSTRSITPTVVEKLCRLWSMARIQDSDGDDPARKSIGIIPDDSDPNQHKAVFLATLLLQLHHPPAVQGVQALADHRDNRKGSSQVVAISETLNGSYRPTPIPKVLLHWLSQNHQPYEEVIRQIYSYDPNPTAHEGYWDMILSLTIRGRLSEVVSFLGRSRFQHAFTAKDDGHGKVGYEGTVLRNVDRVVKRALQVLESCPTLQDDNWDVSGADWLLFRKKIELALNDLTMFAEGRDREMESETSMFEAANFGLKVSNPAISQSARKAESQVPWSVYQNLKIMYGNLLGHTTEIVSSAQDWIEATIGLTAWWNGEEDDGIAVGNLAATRRSLRKGHAKKSRLVDINPTEAYLRQLAFAFERITEDEDEGLFQISSINPVEVGLASIFQGNVDSVIGLLRGWSLPVASAVVEIGGLEGWYDSISPADMLDEFDESDLLVLSSCGPRKIALTHDSILIDYAEKLIDKGLLVEPDKDSNAPEGWELSAKIYSRLQDIRTGEKKLLSLIHSLPLDSRKRVDKVVHICKELNVESEGHKFAERYADSIAENSDDYGTALMYYARAHSQTKVKNIFDLLISLSIVHSMAFPPRDSMDEPLRKLITQPQKSLNSVAIHDQEAARLLHFHLTGYATLRKFYDLRDMDCNLEGDEQPVLKPLARKRAAAVALTALISSAADNISGGLYDESRSSVVHVDGLMALLGEALIFVDQQPPTLSQTQNLVYLAAIESLETVIPRIYAQCEDCFLATLMSYRNNNVAPSPRQMMRKTVSSLTSSSGFSLVGSEMLGESMTSGVGSGSLVNIGGRRNRTEKSKDEAQRGWDWRTGVDEHARGKDILRILRIGLANDMARDWVKPSQ